MLRTAYIIEDGIRHPAGRRASYQATDADTGRHVSPFFSTLLEAIEFLEHVGGYEWNGHIEVHERGGLVGR